MARNQEKNQTELNRLWLSKLHASMIISPNKYLISLTLILGEKRRGRPKLETLQTAAEIKRWIPSIKTELWFCLRHASGIRNYPDYKIKEFQRTLWFCIFDILINVKSVLKSCAQNGRDGFNGVLNWTLLLYILHSLVRDMDMLANESCRKRLALLHS